MHNLDTFPGSGKSKSFQTGANNFSWITPNIENKKNETKKTSWWRQTIKGTIMQIGKALIFDRLRVSILKILHSNYL